MKLEKQNIYEAVEEILYPVMAIDHPKNIDVINELVEYIEEIKKQVSVEPEVKVQIADILRICEISLPNARLVNANTQYAKGWEDAYKQLIDYINDLKG